MIFPLASHVLVPKHEVAAVFFFLRESAEDVPIAAGQLQLQPRGFAT